MIFGFLLIVVGAFGLWFRKPLADFKKNIDQEAIGDLGGVKVYRYVVTAISIAVLMVGLLILGEKLFR